MDATEKHAAQPAAGNEKFLQQIVVDHGPVHDLARLFLQAATELAALGFELALISPAELVKANQANSDNWLPLVQIFDPQWSALTPDNIVTVAILRQGRIVGVHSVRRFDWRGTTMHDEIASYRLLYGDPASQKLPEESVVITATAAKKISGVVAFSGAAWYHPDCRGLGLSRILPRIAKAIALTRWNVDRIVAVMNEGIFKRGFAPHFGYHGVDWDIVYKHSRCGMTRLAVLWIDRPKIETYLALYLGNTQVDGGVLNSGNEDEPLRTLKQRQHQP